MDKLIQKIVEKKTVVFKFVLLVFLTLCISGVIISKYSMIDVDNPTINNKYWVVKQNPEEKIVTYTRNITKETLEKSILFYAENAYVDIFIGDKNVYHYGTETNVSKTPGAAWILYNLNDTSYIKQRITIQMRYVYEVPKNQITIYLGNSSTLILSKIRTELPDILLNIMIFSASSLFIFCYIQNQKYKYDKKFSRKNLCYGLLGFLLFFMSSCLLFTTQIVFPNGLGQYYLFYLSFFAMPLVILLYIEGYVEDKLNLEFLLHLFCISIMVFLQIFNIKDFAEVVPFYCIYILIEFIVITCKIYKTCKTQRKSLLLFTIFSLLLFCVLSYCIQNVSPVHKFKSMLIIKIGFILYIKFELFFYIKKKIADSKNMYHNAYIDAMTGIGNRNLLYRDIKKYKLEETCITFLDINNLKYCNDTYGHNYGDLLIKSAARIICDTYGEEHVYRIGGDEFIILKHNLSEGELIKLRNKLFKRMKDYNSLTTINNTPYLEIACGFSRYQKGDIEYMDIIKRADEIMYENKIYVKSQNRK